MSRRGLLTGLPNKAEFLACSESRALRTGLIFGAVRRAALQTRQQIMLVWRAARQIDPALNLNPGADLEFRER